MILSKLTKMSAEGVAMKAVKIKMPKLSALGKIKGASIVSKAGLQPARITFSNAVKTSAIWLCVGIALGSVTTGAFTTDIFSPSSVAQFQAKFLFAPVLDDAMGSAVSTGQMPSPPEENQALSTASQLVLQSLSGDEQAINDLKTQKLHELVRATLKGQNTNEQDLALVGARSGGDGKERLLISTFQAPVTSAALKNRQALSKQQVAMVHWLSKKYKVAPEPMGVLVANAYKIGDEMRISPSLLLAVMAIESSFNPFAQSQVGAQGLMQVMTQIHSDKYKNFGGNHTAFDPVTNLKVGAKILRDCIDTAGSIKGGLKYYVGAANLPTDTGYGQKVLAEYERLERVRRGESSENNGQMLVVAASQGEGSLSVAHTTAEKEKKVSLVENLPKTDATKEDNVSSI